ncbi:MAG: ABC transporter substrate-binding protein [Halarchaeum sp.]
MSDVTRRRYLVGAGAIGVAGLAGCGGNGGDGTSSSSQTSTTTGSSGDGMTSMRIVLPEGTIHYPMYEAATDQGFFDEQGIDMTVDYSPFGAQVRSVSSGEVDATMVSMMPYIGNYLKGEDLVTFGWNGCLQCINGLYTRASSDIKSIEDLKGKRIGVWSWGSSTVQSYQAVVAEESGLRLRKDFETTTAAPPALLGLLKNEEVDGVIDVSGLTITMQAQPDTYRRLSQLNQMWKDRTGHTLPLTSWFSHRDWYENNTDVAAGLLRASTNATEYWRDNTQSILEEYGETASVDTQAKIDVVDEWANDGQVFHADSGSDYVDATWEFVNLMSDYDFIDSAPALDDIYQNPL